MSQGPVWNILAELVMENNAKSAGWHLSARVTINVPNVPWLQFSHGK